MVPFPVTLNLMQIYRSCHYLMLNISEMVRDKELQHFSHILFYFIFVFFNVQHSNIKVCCCIEFPFHFIVLFPTSNVIDSHALGISQWRVLLGMVAGRGSSREKRGGGGPIVPLLSVCKYSMNIGIPSLSDEF